MSELIPKDVFVEEIVEKIDELRKKIGWSWNRLAHVARLPQATIKSVKNGESKNPTIYTLYRIAWALDVPIEEMFIQSHDGCCGCAYECMDDSDEPCVSCKQNYKDKWASRRPSIGG